MTERLFAYLLGNVIAAGIGYAIGVEYSTPAGFAVWYALACIVDIRYEVSK